MTHELLPAPTGRPTLLLGAALWLLSGAVHAGILLTEIHYNGPTTGTDPDEFVELVNPGTAAFDLGGFSFSDGITFAFPAGTYLHGLEALVIARDVAAFSATFPDFSGPLFDFGGSLSNSGEAITLVDGSSAELLSVTYDDGGLWPRGADGGGDSLQLLPGVSDFSVADSWLGAPPTPGAWSGLASDAAPVPVPLPGTALLLGLGLLGLKQRHRLGP